MPVIIEIISFFYSRLVSEVATNQTKKSLLEKIIMIVKKGQRLKRYQKLKWFVIYVTTRKFSPAGIDSAIENICSIFSIFSKPFPTSPRKNKTNKQTLMHSSRFNFTCYHHPRATPGTSPAIRARGLGSVWSGPVAGVGVGQINIFSLVLRSTFYFSRGLHGCGPQDYVFLRENARICRRMVGEEELIKIKVCPKGMFWNECAYDVHSSGFYFLERKDRDISSA